MISKIECIIITCDNCEAPYEDGSGFSIWPDESSVDPKDDDWYVDGDKHYCPSCYTIDENDNLVLKEQKIKKPQSPINALHDDSRPSAPFQPFADAVKNMENPKDNYTIDGKVFKEGDSVYGTWVSDDGKTHYQHGVVIKNEVTGLWLDDGDGITEIKRFIFLNKQIGPVKPPHNPNWPTPFA